MKRKLYFIYSIMTGLILLTSLATANPVNAAKKEECIPAVKMRDLNSQATQKRTTTQTMKSTYRAMIVQSLDRKFDIEISESEYDLLLRLVEAEAGGEDTEGKMLVANVVINRVRDKRFPESIEGVILQGNGTRTQFSPVGSGRIYRVKVSEDTINAVERVLSGEDDSMGALFFVSTKYAKKDKLKWFYEDLEWLFTHGGHDFFRS